MSDRRAIIIAAFGDRTSCVGRLVRNIRNFVDYPIKIITTRDSNLGFYPLMGVEKCYIDLKWPDHVFRGGVRNSNYFKIKEALRFETTRDFDSVLLLDDDMLIVNKNFVDGFAIAEKFGAALPLNPRTFQLYNLMGSDATTEDQIDLQDTPLFAPAHNFSPLFVSTTDARATQWLWATQKELANRTRRGTLAVWKAMWSTGFTPVNLPQQWCVCGAEAAYIRDYTQRLKGRDLPIPPIMLHLGHMETRKEFGALINETIHG